MKIKSPSFYGAEPVAIPSDRAGAAAEVRRYGILPSRRFRGRHCLIHRNAASQNNGAAGRLLGGKPKLISGNRGRRDLGGVDRPTGGKARQDNHQQRPIAHVTAPFFVIIPTSCG